MLITDWNYVFFWLELLYFPLNNKYVFLSLFLLITLQSFLDTAFECVRQVSNEWFYQHSPGIYVQIDFFHTSGCDFL